MVRIFRVLRALLLAPVLWCCSATPPHPASPKAVPPSGAAYSATIALVNSHIYCAGVWIGPHHVLTANHCVADALESVVGQDRNDHQFALAIQATDKRVDLALLYALFPPDHATASLASSWAIGEHLTIVGHPASVPWVVMSGWIANEMTRPAPDDGGEMTMLWVQAPIWYGNSGGGAFDDEGHLVGICSMRNTQIPDQAWFVSPEEIAGFLAVQR